MNGFNYLYTKEIDELFGSIDDMKRMEGALGILGTGEDIRITYACTLTKQLRASLESTKLDLKTWLDIIKPVWEAMEFLQGAQTEIPPNKDVIEHYEEDLDKALGEMEMKLKELISQESKKDDAQEKA